MTRPRIRKPGFGEIQALYDMIEEAHGRSRYADSFPVNERLAKATLMQCIQRNGNTHEGGAFVAVADAGGQLEGMIVAILQRPYLVLDGLEATDLFFYARPSAHAMTASRLMRAMHKWVPEGALITNAVNDAVTDPDLSGRLLERAGMRRIGHVYQKERT